MTSSRTPDTPRTVAVIGGGAVGVATASFLLRDGHNVVLIEPGGIGEGASFGNAGVLAPSSVVPMSMPGTLMKVPFYLLDPLGPLSIRWSYLPKLAPWLMRFVRAGTQAGVRAQARALRPLLDDSYSAWLPLVRHAGNEALIRRDGFLAVYRSEADFAGDALGYQLRRDNGIAFEVMRGATLWAFEPAISRDYTVGVLFPQAGNTINPNRLVRTVAAAFQRDGGRVVAARASGFAHTGGVLSGIETDAGLIPASAAVVACGAHSRPLAARLGDDVPLDTERGYHVLIADPETRPLRPILDASAKFVSTPMETGLRMAGTVEFAGLDAPPDWRRAEHLMTLGRRLFPGLAPTYGEGRVLRWMGFRPSMPDSLPVIGRSSACADVVYAFGHGHVGLASAARTGMAVADLIARRPPAFDLAPFAPTRF